MKIIKTLTLLWALMLPFMAAALSPQEVLKKAADKINTSAAITARFNGSTHGTLTSSGKKFSIVANGFGIWYDGKNMWTYSSNAGETSLTSPTPQELLETNPLEIIKANAAKYTATKVKESGSLYTLKLTPKSKADNVKTATLVIDTSTWFPSGIDITFTNNSRFAVNISSITAGQSPAASAFVYPESAYPGVEVVDLR